MSRYLKNQNVLFLDIPSIAGDWVDLALENLDIPSRPWRADCVPGIPKGHALLSHCGEANTRAFKSIFAFVRHPITYYETVWRQLSVVKFRRSAAKKYDWHPFREPALVYDVQFNVWISNMIGKYPGWMSRLIELYVGPEGAEFCSFIGTVENIAEDMVMLLTSLSEEFEDNEPHIRARLSQLPIVSKLEKKGSRIKWNGSLQGQLLAVEASLLNRFYSK